MYPRDWKRFSKAAADRRIKNSTAANRFAARYRLAACFEAVVFSGVAQGTTDGFGALLRVTLAANALEGALGLGEKTMHGIEIPDPDLAARLRAVGGKLFDTLLTHTRAEKRGAQLAQRLDALRIGRSDDLWCLAKAIRNTLAHGVLTSDGAGVTRSRKLQKLLVDLAQAILRSADGEFHEFLCRELGPEELAS